MQSVETACHEMLRAIDSLPSGFSRWLFVNLRYQMQAAEAAYHEMLRAIDSLPSGFSRWVLVHVEPIY